MGNAVVPLFELHPKITVYAVDFAKSAIEIFTEAPYSQRVSGAATGVTMRRGKGSPTHYRGTMRPGFVLVRAQCHVSREYASGNKEALYYIAARR